MSSETLMPRSRVLRGSAVATVRGATLDADLSLLEGLGSEAAGRVPTGVALAAAREEASRVGYEDGFAAGMAAGAQQARLQQAEVAAATGTALAALHQAVAELTARQAAAVADVEQHIASVAMTIAATILDRELTTATDPGADAIRRALQLAPARVDAVARLHPEDVNTLGDITSITSDRVVTVIADGAVERGGCVLEVGPCRVDAQIGPALDRVREVLQG